METKNSQIQLINDKIKEYLSYKLERDAALTRMDSLKAEIILLMQQNKLAKYEDDNENLASITTICSSRLDTDKVKKFLGENVIKYMKESSYVKCEIVSKESRDARQRGINKK